MKIRVLTLVTVISALFLAGCWGKSDADLGKMAGEALKANKALSNVTVAVKGGVATIKGEVADEASKKAAEAAAKVYGVKSVVNEVTVKQAAPVASAGDADMVKKIIDAWKKGGFTDLKADVVAGVATLTGEVASQAKLGEAVKIVNDAKPLKIENKLTVKK